MKRMRFAPALLVGALACATATPEQVNEPRLPDAGADGEYEVRFPTPKRGEARWLTMVVSEDLRFACPFDPHFALDEVTPRPQDQLALEALASCLQRPEIRDRDVILTGRADARGSGAYNLNLARARAERVKQILVDHGVDPARLLVRSEGEYDARGHTELFSHGYDRRVDVELSGDRFVPARGVVRPTQSIQP